MLCIMVSGLIASGKSTAAHYLATRADYYVSMDELVKHKLYQDEELCHELNSCLGEEVFREGRLERALFAQKLFSSKEMLTRVNEKVLPRAYELLKEELAPFADTESICVVELPLLVEAPYFSKLADHILTIRCPYELRLARALKRHMSVEDFQARNALQSSAAAIEALSDSCIDNDKGLDELYHALDLWWERHVV